LASSQSLGNDIQDDRLLLVPKVLVGKPEDLKSLAAEPIVAALIMTVSGSVVHPVHFDDQSV
jgi:hypothetical protein